VKQDSEGQEEQEPLKPQVSPVAIEDQSDEVMMLAVRSRRLARSAAMRILYALDSIGQLDSATVALNSALVIAAVGPGLEESHTEAANFANVIVEGLLKSVLEIDRLVQHSSEHWTLARICRIDRNILRVAIFELVTFQDIPVSVIINEAVEIAKEYAGPDAPSFINGVLDHAARSIRNQDPALKAV